MDVLHLSAAMNGPLKRVNFEFNKDELREHQRAQRLHQRDTHRIMKNTDMRKLQYMVPYLKVAIVYEYLIHTKSKKEISTNLGVKYPKVPRIIRSNPETARIIKLLP